MDATLLRDKIRGCLVGAAIGDALGMPVETLSPEEILTATNGEGVKGFLAPIQRKIKDTQGLQAGVTTDDTLLMLCAACSLIERKRFDLEDQAKSLVDTYYASPFNFGLSTKTGAEEIGLWIKTNGMHGRHPTSPARVPESDGKGCGNGVAMKVEPLAVHHAVRYGTGQVDPLLSDVMAFGLMTHGDPRASISAYAMSIIIGAALLDERMLLRDVIGITMIAEKRFRFYRKNGKKFSSALLRARDHLSSANEVRDRVGTGGNCLESVAFSIATFFRHPTDFRTGVLEAVNAGGDADTTASMVGGMIGASVGLSQIPSELTTGLCGMKRIIRVADDLADSLDVPKD